ncbi:putative ribonuclease H-like domain-containing protein [Tanacetum coccineum]
MNYVLVVAGNQTNGVAGTKDNIVAGQAQKEKDLEHEYILIPLCTTNPLISQGPKDNEGDAGMKPTEVDERGASDKNKKDAQDTRSESERLNQREMLTEHTNGTNSINTVSTPVSTAGPSFDNVVPSPLVNTARPSISTANAFKEHLFERFSPFKSAFTLPSVPNVSSMDNTSIFRNAYDDVEEEVDMNNVFRNKKDERGIVVKNKARLVAQGHTQEEGIDYDEVFAPVARIEAIRLFLAYASFKDFVVFQMDVKTSFLYEKIEEEVYVCQLLSFEDPYFPDKVYKVEKALYGLHQAPRAWYETLSTYLLDNGFHRGQIDKTLFIKRHKDDILLVQIYVDDIIFGSTKKEMSTKFEKLMHDNQDKNVGKILKKFDYVSVKTASTPMETNKALIKDEEAEDVDVPKRFHHLTWIAFFDRWTIAVSSLDRKSTIRGKSKEIRTPRYLSLVVPLKKVGDEAVHKELGDRMERAATTASSLEAEHDSENPTIYTSLIQQFWETASASTSENEEMEITATIDGRVKTITEASIRRNLKLEDSDGIPTLPNAKFFEQLAFMGYASDSDKLTFQKGHFSPQWRFLIHTILHCLSLKKTAWEQFSSNIATAIICLATNRTFNFSKMIFEGMLKNLDSRSKFLMYPRFIQIFLNKHKRHLLPHKKTYVAPTLTQKLFSNMRRVSKGYTGVNIPLFPTMLTAPESSPSRITSSPSLSPQTHPSTSQQPPTPPFMQTIHDAEEPATMPHDSSQPRVQSLGSDEGSLTLNELKVLCTTLSKKVEDLQNDLKQTKLTYGVAYTKLILRVKKLEHKVKASKSRRRARVIISDNEEDLEDSYKQGRIIAEIDQNPSISLVQDEGTSWIQEDAETQGRTSVDTEILLEQEEPTELVKDPGSGEKVEKEISTAKVLVSIASAILEVSTAIPKRQVHIRRSAEKRKDKGKTIMKDDESELDKRKECVAETTQAQVIDWSKPAVLRYHAQQNISFSKAEVRKNMCMYLKNQGGYKQSHFKGMSYEDIRHIFERVWDQNQSFVPKDSEIEKEVKYLIIDWEVFTEESRSYWRIIRVGNHTEVYQVFEDMLKKFDRDDLEKLWDLVKKKFSSTEPIVDKEKVLWVELKRLFEPNDDDTLW